jgi:hypothetical protein
MVSTGVRRYSAASASLNCSTDFRRDQRALHDSPTGIQDGPAEHRNPKALPQEERRRRVHGQPAGPDLQVVVG